MLTRITFVKVRRIPAENINEDLQWLGNALGLFSLRDRDSSCFRVFIMLVRLTKKKEGITSDDIAQRLNLSRGTVIHHLTRLMEAGIVIRDHNGYILREQNLQRLIHDLRREMEDFFSELDRVAQEIDQKLN
ncbi:TPA: winged helix-turn-helix transcriptional regulator [Candidatus Woesearchaeota archaeon]|nr:winged helix-turn-helix transcriptional regulator [Candidatus Woesearchaeota archaeon]